MAAELFDKEFLRKLDYLDLIAKRVVIGRQQANRPSVKKGASTEFKDFREYSPGDDLRFLDWSVLGRLDELVIKLYRQEEEIDLWVLLDSSASMAFGEPAKFDYARRVAAALAYIGMSNLDSASVTPFSDRIQRGRERLRGRGNVFALLEFLQSAGTKGQTDLVNAGREFCGRVQKPALVVILSDFYGLQSAQRAIDQLRFQKHQVYIVQLVSPWEVDPPVRGEYRLVDVETSDDEQLTITDGLLRRYKENYAKSTAELRKYCLGRNVGYALTRSDTPFDEFVLQLLQTGGLVA